MDMLPNHGAYVCVGRRFLDNPPTRDRIYIFSLRSLLNLQPSAPALRTIGKCLHRTAVWGNAESSKLPRLPPLFPTPVCVADSSIFRCARVHSGKCLSCRYENLFDQVGLVVLKNTESCPLGSRSKKKGESSDSDSPFAATFRRSDNYISIQSHERFSRRNKCSNAQNLFTIANVSARTGG